STPSTHRLPSWRRHDDPAAQGMIEEPMKKTHPPSTVPFLSLYMLAVLAAPAVALPAGSVHRAMGFRPNSMIAVGDGVRDLPPAFRTEHRDAHQAVDDNLKARFDAATGSARALTEEAARKASWGFVADHFREIDVDHDGRVSFHEVSRFMHARSPVKRRAETIQIIE
ncbi:MAG: EF-hand domain-containing protein, partial [Alphaproteobacteria bacterium]